MAQQLNHVFTKEESQRGVSNSRSSRKAWIRLEKQLARMNIEKETLSKIMELVKVSISSPGGVFLFGSLLIDLLDRIGYFGSTTSPAQQTTQKTSKQQTAIDQARAFAASVLPPGLSNLFNLGNPIPAGSGGSLGTNPLGTSSSNHVTAELLQTELFAISMVQALGGAQGISTLATSALSALG